MEITKVAFSIVVTGVVQGVGFRYFTRQQAQKLGINGTVQNKADGSVLIHVEGEEPIVHKFLAWCHNGPDTASVDKLEYRPALSKGSTSFEIIR